MNPLDTTTSHDRNPTPGRINVNWRFTNYDFDIGYNRKMFKSYSNNEEEDKKENVPLCRMNNEEEEDKKENVPLCRMSNEEEEDKKENVPLCRMSNEEEEDKKENVPLCRMSNEAEEDKKENVPLGWMNNEEVEQPKNSEDNCGVEYHPEISDDFWPCMECGKVFKKDKALFGHLRLHRNKGYKGACPPAYMTQKYECYKRAHHRAYIMKKNELQGSSSKIHPSYIMKNNEVQGSPAKKISKKRRGSIGISAKIREKVEGGGDEEEDPATTAANILMDMSRAVLHVSDYERIMDVKKKVKNTSFTCNQCNRSFLSHQALCAHIAGHHHRQHKVTIIKSAGTMGGLKAQSSVALIGVVPKSAGTAMAVVPSSAAVLHTCEICGASFPSGQALGGHKRKHYNAAAATHVFSPSPPIRFKENVTDHE